MKKIIALTLMTLVLTACVGMTKSSFSKSEPVSTSSQPVATVFSKFNFLDPLSGKKQNLGELISNKYALINVWATWCPPCRAEIPDLILVNSQYRAKNVVVVGVSVDGDVAPVAKFMKEKGINYPVLMDDGSLSGEFGIRGIPTTFFVDKQGRIVNKKIGADNAAFFSAQLDALVQR